MCHDPLTKLTILSVCTRYTESTVHTASLLFIGFESMLWQVPITIATQGNAKALQFVLSQQSTTVTLEGVGEGDWVLVSVCVCV